MAHKVIYDALIKKYEADIADASAKITILMTETRIIPEHIDVTGEIDKLLGKIEEAEQSQNAFASRKSRSFWVF